jgi:hypothetical protein
MSRQNTPHGVRRIQRRADALTLRADGHTFDSIGDELGITRQAAQQLVTRAISDLPKESIAEVRALESLRLDALQAAIWADAPAVDVRAVDRVLRIMERRARMLGLDLQQADSRERVEITVNWGRPDPRNQPEPLIVESAS